MRRSTRARQSRRACRSSFRCTRARWRALETLGLAERLRTTPGLRTTEPLGYNDFVTLMASAKLVATDSGGIQEETTALGIPCLTLREGQSGP